MTLLRSFGGMYCQTSLLLQMYLYESPDDHHDDHGIQTRIVSGILLKKQERLSNHIRRRNNSGDVPKINAANKSNDDYHEHPKRRIYSIDTERASAIATMPLDVEWMARSEQPKIPEEPAEEINWESDDLTEDADAQGKNQSDAQVSTTNTTTKTKTRRSSSRPIRMSFTSRNQPRATRGNHSIPELSPVPHLTFSFTHLGEGLMVNQNMGNVALTNISNAGNEGSEYYHYH